MKKTTKQSCMAVTSVEFAGEVDSITVCGLPSCDKPNALYVPLCASHRALAEASEIKVFTDKVIAEYRI